MFLLDLYLTRNEFGREGSAALGRLLNSPASKMQRLKLVTNDLDDECIKILARGLMNNTTIGIGSIGPEAHNSKWLAYLLNLLFVKSHLLRRKNRFGK